MSALYVSDQGAVIGKESERLVVRKEGTILFEVPISRIEKVMIFGAVQISTQAMGVLLEARVPTAFCNFAGRLRGVLTPVGGKNVYLRVCQVKRLEDAVFRLETARENILAKLRGQRSFLMRSERNSSADLQPDTDWCGQIEALAVAAESAQDLAGLRGLEGRAAAVYFRAFPALVLRRDWGFPGRRRRPPPDPVNCLLSFGYAVLASEAASLLAGNSLDPCIGYMHELDYGRPSLALDLIEEFRVPVVDRTVARFLNLGMAGADDFCHEDGGLRMKEMSRKRFLAEYDKTLREAGLRGAMRAQVDRLCLSIVRGNGYHGYRWEA